MIVYSPIQRLFRAALAASLILSALLYFVWSWRWPLVGDAALIHYIAFLIQRGWAPYAQLGDMNMPGSFLIEIAAMHLFGMGSLAWRLFDFTLLGLASASFFVIAHRPRAAVGLRTNWLAGLFASCLFILIHGRDGLSEGGQRDLTMAVLLLAATAFLFLAVRMRAIYPGSPASTGAPGELVRWGGNLLAGVVWPAAAFGLLSGIAATIKPTSLPLTLTQLALALWAHRTSGARPNQQPPTQNGQLVLSAALAYLVGPAVALIFLLREHALAAFLAGFHGIVPYYAGLGHRPLGFVLLHSLSPLLPLVLAWLCVVTLNPSLRNWTRDWERTALLAGVLFGLLNCIVQARALPYYRYPLLVFLLPLMALDFTRAFDSAQNPGAPSIAASPRIGVPASSAGGVGWVGSRIPRLLALLALAFGGFFLAPQSAVLIHRYRWWQTDFISTLQQNLNALGGSALSGRIQCIDSISGCGNVLYRMRLEPATGVLSDFLLFGSISDQQPPGQIPILRDTRANLLAAIAAHPPQVIVVTSHLHIDGPDNFQKLARWPAFAQFLADRYTLQTEWSPTRTARWWSREETPASYRIYVLRPNPRVP